MWTPCHCLKITPNKVYVSEIIGTIMMMNVLVEMNNTRLVENKFGFVETSKISCSGNHEITWFVTP